MYQEAFSSGSLAIEIDPDNVRAYLLRATALKQMHEHEAARADLRAILRLDPAHKEATQMLEGLRRTPGDLRDLVSVSGTLVSVSCTPTGHSHNNKLQEEPGAQHKEEEEEEEEEEHNEGTRVPLLEGLPINAGSVLVQKNSGLVLKNKVFQKNAQTPSHETHGDNSKLEKETEAEQICYKVHKDKVHKEEEEEEEDLFVFNDTTEEGAQELEELPNSPLTALRKRYAARHAYHHGNHNNNTTLLDKEAEADKKEAAQVRFPQKEAAQVRLPEAEAEQKEAAEVLEVQ